MKVTPGESEPMSISLYCLEDLENVKARIGNAGTIPFTAWTTYTVISVPMSWKMDWSFKGARDDKIYDIVPIHLLELPEGIQDKNGQCLQFISDLKYPEEANQEIYHGTFIVTTTRGELEIPFFVEVLPFKLINMERIWQRGWFEGGEVTDPDEVILPKKRRVI